MLPVETLFFTRFLEQMRTLMVRKKTAALTLCEVGVSRKRCSAALAVKHLIDARRVENHQLHE